MAPQLTPARTLKVNCAYRKNTIFISEGDQPPTVLAKYNAFTNKIVFKAGPAAAKVFSDTASTSSADLETETPDVIANSKIHNFSIGCDVTLRGRAMKLTPAARLNTRYNYASQVYATDPHRPAVMMWRSNSVVRFFDHELRDEHDAIVARFNPKYSGIKNLASIELFGPLAWDSRAVEEVVVTGLTLYLCMIYRSSNPVSLLGALVTSPGREREKQDKLVREEWERSQREAETGWGGKV